MVTREELFAYFEQGFTPSQLVKQGLPKSTVYKAYREWLMTRAFKLPKLTVYIAHSVRDYSILQRLINLLQAAGIEVVGNFVAMPGTHVNTKIVELISKSDIVVVLIQKDSSRNRDFLIAEISTALAYKKPVIPIIEKGSENELPAILQGFEYLKFDESNINHTIEWVISYIDWLRREKQQLLIQQLNNILGIIGCTLIAIFGVAALGLLVSELMKR